MPLARIITNSADDSLELSMQLRSRGFRVETVAPDHVPETPADVEVRLEECAPEDVLSRAAVVKESEDLWVFVAPGALDDQVRPMRMIPLIPPVGDIRARTGVAPVIEVKEAVAPQRVEPEDDPIMAEPAARQVETSIPPAQIQVVSRNGSKVVSGMVPIAKDTTAAPAVLKPSVSVRTEAKPSLAIKAPAGRTTERAKVGALPKAVEIPQIPRVPERVEPKFLTAATVQNLVPTRKRSSKISLETGPKFWRRACAAGALVVVAGLVALVVALQPALPAGHGPAAATGQPVFFSTTPRAGTANRMAEQVSANQSKKTTAPTRTRPPRFGTAAQAAGTTEHPRRQRSSSDDGRIAEDTVVFYDRGPVAHRAKPASKANIKRYSDAN